MGAVWIVNEVDEPVPVIDLYLQHPEHGKAQESRHLGTNRVAYVGGIKRDDIKVFLPQMGELERQLIRTKDVLDCSAEAFHRNQRVRRYLCDFPGSGRVSS